MKGKIMPLTNIRNNGEHSRRTTRFVQRLGALESQVARAKQANRMVHSDGAAANVKKAERDLAAFRRKHGA
jgi:hypothetical protein